MRKSWKPDLVLYMFCFVNGVEAYILPGHSW